MWVLPLHLTAKCAFSYWGNNNLICTAGPSKCNTILGESSELNSLGWFLPIQVGFCHLQPKGSNEYHFHRASYRKSETFLMCFLCGRFLFQSLRWLNRKHPVPTGEQSGRRDQALSLWSGSTDRALKYRVLCVQSTELQRDGTRGWKAKDDNTFGPPMFTVKN